MVAKRVGSKGHAGVGAKLTPIAIVEPGAICAGCCAKLSVTEKVKVMDEPSTIVTLLLPRTALPDVRATVDRSIFGAGEAEGDCDGRDEVEDVGEAEGGFEGDGAAVFDEVGEFDAPVDLDADGGGELDDVADGGSCEALDEGSCEALDEGSGDAPVEGSGEAPFEGSGDAPVEGVACGVQTRVVPLDEKPGEHAQSDHVLEGSHCVKALAGHTGCGTNEQPVRPDVPNEGA